MMNEMNLSQQTLSTHLLELRQRLIVCACVFLVAFALCYTYSDQLFQVLVGPLASSLKGNGRRLIYTHLTEAFTSYIKVAAFGAFFITFPLIAFQIWRFVAPGLYQQERRLFLSTLILTPLLFLAGIAFAYFVVFPAAYTFFLSFETITPDTLLPLQLEAKVNEYLSFTLRVMMAFGICFELPILLTLLAWANIVTREMLIKRWRIVIFLIFLVSAFITPPDVISMLALALPLILLFGLSIMAIGFLDKQRKI